MTKLQWDGPDGSVWDLMNGPVGLAPGVMGLDEPETTTFVSSAPLLDGQRMTGTRHPARRVFWPLSIPETPTAAWLAAHKAFKNSLSYTKYGKFTVALDGEADRYLLLRKGSQNDLGLLMDPQITTREALAIELVADDPWWKGPDVSKTFQTAETPLPFYAVTTDRVFNLMSSNTVANATLNNPGDVPVWLVHRFDGPLTSFTIGYSAGIDPLLPNANVTAALTLNLGEYAILDTNPSQQTLTKYVAGIPSDVTNLLSAASWAQVQPGANQPIYVQLTGSGTLTTKLTPQYYRAF